MKIIQVTDQTEFLAFEHKPNEWNQTENVSILLSFAHFLGSLLSSSVFPFVSSPTIRPSVHPFVFFQQQTDAPTDRQSRQPVWTGPGPGWKRSESVASFWACVGWRRWDVFFPFLPLLLDCSVPISRRGNSTTKETLTILPFHVETADWPRLAARYIRWNHLPIE